MNKYVSIEQVYSARQVGANLCMSVTRDLIETWCATELQWVANETHNAPRLWAQVTRHLRGYLGVLWVVGSLQGKRPTDAFRVACDQTTMTQADIRGGHVICQIGVAPLKPSEFIYYRIRIRLQPLSTHLQQRAHLTSMRPLGQECAYRRLHPPGRLHP